MIIKGSAIHRFKIMQEKNAGTFSDRKLIFSNPSAASTLLKKPNSVLYIPTRHNKMDTYAGIAQGNIKSVLYTLANFNPFAFSPSAIKKDTTTCMTIFTTVQRMVVKSAFRNPESTFKSARLKLESPIRW